MATPTASAAPKRSAWRKLVERRLRFARSAASARRPAPAALLPPRRGRRQPRRRATRQPGSARRRSPRRGRQGVGELEKQALGDQQRERHREAEDREAQRDREAVAGGGADQAHARGPRAGPSELVRTPSAAAMPISGAAAACQPARARAGASIPGKPASRAPVAIAPLVGASKPSSRTSASPTGTASRTPRRSAGPGSLGPIAKSGEARSRRALPGGVEQHATASSQTAGPARPA